jgi:colicin import membrane protein/protein TonB
MTDAGHSHSERSALTARARVSLGPGVALSVGVHALMFGGAWVYSQITAPRIDLSKKPIVARLVRLGQVRPPQLLPRRDAAPRAAAPAQPVAVPSASPAPTAGPASPKQPSREDMMKEALARISGQVSKTPPPKEETEGAPDGSALGTSIDPEEGDRYLAVVRATIMQHYVLPTTISERERLFLRAVVIVWIAPDGKVIRFKFEKRSDNDQFDRALESAMQRIEKFPPPPPAFAPQYRDNGIGLNFAP